MPCSQETDSLKAKHFIDDTWKIGKKYFYGAEDVSFVTDPATNSGEVLRILFEKGSFSPHGTAEAGDGHVTGGSEFYVTPFNNTSYKRGLIRYDVLFDKDFDWVKGGKLPGLYGGIPMTGCTGGKKANGKDCFSIRGMWREKGYGEAYVYLPQLENKKVCANPMIKCNDNFGTSLARGVIEFGKNKWSTIEIYTEMNDLGKSNGKLKMWQDGRAIIDLEDGVTYRHTKELGVTSILFSTFFGGGTKDYATPKNTYAYFKNIEISVADPENVS
ncbi:hypothetical protein BJV82DRAFT_508464 [Fennellomyces sp. T-0311]|nr:hypothetical protein BJV82DRAFT_508464 [Fennellomyces sp. T-0311]